MWLWLAYELSKYFLLFADFSCHSNIDRIIYSIIKSIKLVHFDRMSYFNTHTRLHVRHSTPPPQFFVVTDESQFSIDQLFAFASEKTHQSWTEWRPRKMRKTTEEIEICRTHTIKSAGRKTRNFTRSCAKKRKEKQKLALAFVVIYLAVNCCLTPLQLKAHKFIRSSLCLSLAHASELTES